MTWSRLGAVAVALSLIGCERIREDAECSPSGTCTRGLVCSEAFNLCYAEPPTITLQHPLPGESFDGGSLVLSGTVVDNTRVKAAEYKLGTFAAQGVWVPLQLSEGRFLTEVRLPETDETKFHLTVRAFDDGDAESHVEVAPTVDSRGPTVSSATPADGTSGALETKLTLEFSEPVRLPASALRLTPSPASSRDGGEWARMFEIPLQPGTHYVAELVPDAVADRFGHPLKTGFVRRFYTAPRAPLPGATIDVAPNTLLDFGAASDGDGVVSVVAKVGTDAGVFYQWQRFHPATGEAELINLTAGRAQDTKLEVVAGVTPSPVMSRPTRVSGFIRGDGSAAGAQAYWRIDDANSSAPRVSTSGLLPFGPSCADPGTSDIGFISSEMGNSFYVRPPAAALPLQFTPSLTASRSAENWEVLVVSGGDLRRQSTRVKCAPPTSTTFAYNASIASNLSTEPQLSIALAEADRALYVYQDDKGQRRELCHSCVYAADTSACPMSEARPATSLDWVVASGHQGGKVLGARKTDSNRVELMETDLTVSCHEPWKSLGFVTAKEAVTKFLPLMFGRRPGALVQSGTQLQVLYP